jgi:hypothetical protein
MPSGSLHTGSVSRAVKGIAEGPAVALDRRRELLGLDALGEREQQIRLPLDGRATQNLTWGEVDIAFDLEFYNATEQRDVPYTIPHFSYGTVLITPDLIVVYCCVRSFKQNDDDMVSGCRVAVGVWDPTFTGTIADTIPVADRPVIGTPFAGWIDLTFQGYGAPSESGADIDIEG